MTRWVIWLIVLPFSILAQEKPYAEYGIENDAEDLPMGLKVGEMAPEFELKDSDGIIRSFKPSTESREKPLVIIFYRGQWCPVCVRYLSNLQDSLPFILETGAEFWAITPETAENARVTKEKTKAEFPILIDENEEVMHDYDVIFDVTSFYQTKVSVGRFTSIAGNNGKETAELPVPATFVIDPSGKIIFRQFDYNYKNRASVKDVLYALKKE